MFDRPGEGLAAPIAVSGVFGLLAGAVGPTALYSVEIAQVISGVVVLPPSVPMAIHHGRVFSIVIDAAAALLYLGLSEGAVCHLFTALMGALACVSLSVAAFAFTRSRAAACLMPLLMYHYNWGAEAHRYPIGLPIADGDLGANGMTASLLTLGLIALRLPAGAFLLGLLPGMHISWAAATWLITTAGAWFDRETRTTLWRQRRAFALGVGVVIAFWLAHQALAPAFPAGPESVDTRLVKGFMRYWDGHRAAIGVPTGTWAALFAADITFFVLAAAALRSGFAQRRGVRYWLIGAFAMSIPALGNSLIDEIAPGLLPVPLSAMMLSRWLNLNTVVVPSLAISLAGYAIRDRQFGRFAAPTGLLLAAVAVLPVVFALIEPNYRLHLDLWPPEDRALVQRVRERPGMLICTAALPFRQLRTRRAQLLDLDLIDVLPYAPAASESMESILQDVYGASLLNPTGQAQLDDLDQRWAGRPVTEWIALGQKYGVTDILVPAEWPRLTLPLVETSAGLALYSIPNR